MKNKCLLDGVLTLLAGLVLACLLAGNASAGSGKRVALMLEHDSAAPYTNMLRDGLARAGRDFGLASSVIVATDDDDQEEAFRKAAQENDLVIVATDNMHEILRNNAANFRRKKFGVIDAGIRAPNVSCVTFADEQAACLAGAAAAMLAKARGSGTIGWLSGMDTPAMRSLFSGFSACAEMTMPDIQVAQAIAGSFTDAEAAAEKAAQLASTASVIALAAGAANPAAAKAIRNSKALVICLDAWQPDLAPGKTAAGITKAADHAIYQLCEDFAKDRFRAKEIVIYDLANKGVSLAGFDDKGKYPDISRRVSELKREIENGNIALRSMRQRTLCDCLD